MSGLSIFRGYAAQLQFTRSVIHNGAQKAAARRAAAFFYPPVLPFYSASTRISAERREENR